MKSMDIKVKNISFAKFASLKDRREYDYYLRYGVFNPVDSFELGSFVDRSFGFVKDMQELLNFEGLTWIKFFEMIAKETNTTVEVIAKKGLFTLQQSRVYCRVQIEEINKLESQHLSSGVTADEDRAGIDEFKIFRSFPQYDKLIKEWGLKWDEVEAMPYSRAFAKLKYDKTVSDYIANLQKIKSKR